MDTLLNEITPQFQKHAWDFTRTNENSCRFSKKTKEFKVSIGENEIEVLVPLKDSESLYKTNFTDYYNASEYLLQHLNYQEN